jgi:sugar transferase (PEP-CTERM system associated)
MRIFNRYFSSYDLLLVLGDIALTFLATASVRVVMVFTGLSSNPQWVFWSIQGAVMALIVVIAFYYSDLYAIDQTLSVRELLLRFMSGLGIACIVIAAVSYPMPEFGKTIYMSEVLLIGANLCLWRLGSMRIIKRARIHARILIIGVQTIGKLVAEELCKQQKLGMEVVGFVGDSAGPMALSYGNPTRVLLPVFSPGSVAEVIVQRGIDRILLGGAEGYEHSLGQALVKLRAKGIVIEDCHSFYERLVSKIAIADLSPQWIALSKGFRRDRVILAVKRLVDIGASGIGLWLSAPIALLTAIAIKIDSAGPVLYRQERIGQNDARFTLCKFRSMTQDAESNVGPVWASETDARMTRVGRVIRKLRIDEIPQMVNVLKGEMSFVGPRPERPFFVQQLQEKIPFYHLRHSVKPGITGWAQISYPYGDSEEAAIEKLQYDLYYIKHMSPVFDLQIIFETLKVILLGRGGR